MAHRNLSALVFGGLAPTTAATLISLLGDEGLPGDLRIVERLVYQPWHTSRSGLLVVGMDPDTDLARVSTLIQDRTTYWEVAVCLRNSIAAYQPALLAQGAIKVLPHPEDELESTRDELRDLLTVLTATATETLGLELSDLIQLYAEKRAPRTIRIAGEGVIGSLYLRDGMIIHAETMDEDEGMTAFNRIFRVKSPELRVHSGCLTTHSSLKLPAMTALLEGARVHDEDLRDQSGSGEGGPTGDDLKEALGEILDDFDFGSSCEDVPKKVPPLPHEAAAASASLEEDDLDLD